MNAPLKPVPEHGVALDVRSVSKQFDERPVLRELDLHLNAGEFVALVGRSGCGKSTLLRLIAGLETASSGQITANGVPHAQIRQQTRLMFQDSRLLPWKTVLHNVGLGLTGDWKPAAVQALEEVGLAEHASKWPAQLSGGQRQRVALARALIHAPRLLLLDEPLGALDALTRIEMHQLIERVWQKHGFTVLLVTHDVQEAVALADRVILIEEGRIGLDQSIALPRSRSRGTPEFAALEEHILNRVLATPQGQPKPEPTHFGALRWAL